MDITCLSYNTKRYCCVRSELVSPSRFGFGKDGSRTRSLTTVQRGFRTICTSGDSIVDDVGCPLSRCAEAVATADAAVAEEEEEEELRLSNDYSGARLLGHEAFATLE